jgi:hypothetical protein
MVLKVIRCVGVVWSHVVHDMNQWQGAANTVIDFDFNERRRKDFLD